MKVWAGRTLRAVPHLRFKLSDGRATRVMRLDGSCFTRHMTPGRKVNVFVDDKLLISFAANEKRPSVVR